MMIAFNGDESFKQALISEVKKHRKADKIIHGVYGHIQDSDFKGCAIGCSIKSLSIIQGKPIDTNNHQALSDATGIPLTLYRLQDTIFENLHKPDDVMWPERFYEAAQTGADLSKVWPIFAVWLLADKKHGVINYAQSEKTKADIKHIAFLYQNNGTKEEFEKAYDSTGLLAASADIYSSSDNTYFGDATAAYCASYAAKASYDFATAKESVGFAAYAACKKEGHDKRAVIISKKLLSIMKSIK